MPPKGFFVIDVAHLYEEEIHFRKLFLKQFEMVLEHLTLVTFDPLTP